MEFYLPEGATNVEFQRAFGSMTNLIPAPEVVQVAEGWVDTLPLRPGQGRLNLIISYSMPYEEGLELRHSLAYPLNSATLMLPDAGVEVSGAGWTSAGAQDTGAGDVFLTYANNDVLNATEVEIVLAGEPERVVVGGSQGNSLVRNENNELIIGGAALAVIVGAAIFMVNQWRNQVVDDEEAVEALLFEVADLDDAYEAGEVNKKQYQRQRQRLMEELVDIWPVDEF